MKVLHKLTAVLVFIVMLGVGLGLLSAGIKDQNWLYALSFAEGARYMALSLGSAILLVLLIYVYTAIPGKTQEQFLSFDQKSGTVSISTEAIAEYVMKLDGEFPSIMKMKPRVVTGRNCIDVIVDVHIKAGPQIHEICELIQKRVRASIIDGLGISDVRKVEVSVEKIVRED